MGTITVMPNQSMPDVILQGCGSLEAGIQFCIDNDIAISDYPDVGMTYQITAGALASGDAGVLQYLVQNGWVIGTLGIVPELGYAVVLKPVMMAQPSDPNPPDVSGFYSYNLVATMGFVNLNPIAAGDYPSSGNEVSYETEERVIAGNAPGTAHENATSLVMSDRSIPYKIPWVTGRGFMMIWSDLSASEKTVTFADTAGNSAYVSPLVVLDNNTQAVKEYLIADIRVETMGTGMILCNCGLRAAMVR